MADPEPGTMRVDFRLEDADGFYERWLDAHAGLTESQSFELNARLVLLLANQVADRRVLEQCVQAAAKPFRSG